MLKHISISVSSHHHSPRTTSVILKDPPVLSPRFDWFNLFGPAPYPLWVRRGGGGEAAKAELKKTKTVNWQCCEYIHSIASLKLKLCYIKIFVIKNLKTEKWLQKGQHDVCTIAVPMSYSNNAVLKYEELFRGLYVDLEDMTRAKTVLFQRLCRLVHYLFRLITKQSYGHQCENVIL